MKSLNNQIIRYLDQFGLKHSNMGFRYLLSSITIALQNPELLIKISDIYQKVAEEYSSSTSKVERTIRYAVTPMEQTNKEFIAIAVDYLSRDFDQTSSSFSNSVDSIASI